MEITFQQLVTKLRVAPRRFGLLLGAGCSVGSGIPTAGQIAAMIGATQAQGEALDYADALKSLGPQAIQQAYLRQRIEGKRSGRLHADLAQLVEDRWVTAVFTTNFDHLIESALGGPDKHRPGVVVSHECIASSLCQVGGLYPDAVESYVVKLHGDYLLPGVKNQPWEVAVLPDGYSALFQGWLSLQGLIVVGYGSADRSVISELERAAVRNGLPLGLVYLARDGSRLPDWIRRLAEMRPVPSWVEVLRVADAESFFAGLCSALCP